MYRARSNLLIPRVKPLSEPIRDLFPRVLALSPVGSVLYSTVIVLRRP